MTDQELEEMGLVELGFDTWVDLVRLKAGVEGARFALFILEADLALYTTPKKEDEWVKKQEIAIEDLKTFLGKE